MVSDWGAVQRPRRRRVAAGIDLEMPVVSGGRTDAAARRRRCRPGRSTRSVLDTRAPAACSTWCATVAASRSTRSARRRRSPRAGARGRRPRRSCCSNNDGDPAARARGVGRRHRRVRRGRRATRVRGSLADQPDAGRQRARRDPRGYAGRRRVAFAPGFTPSHARPGGCWRAARRGRRAGRGRTWPCVFLGLPEDDESEGYDRDAHRPAGRAAGAPRRVLAAEPEARSSCSRNGGVVALPFADRVAGDRRGVAARPGRRRRRSPTCSTARWPQVVHPADSSTSGPPPVAATATFGPAGLTQ